MKSLHTISLFTVCLIFHREGQNWLAFAEVAASANTDEMVVAVRQLVSALGEYRIEAYRDEHPVKSLEAEGKFIQMSK